MIQRIKHMWTPAEKMILRRLWPDRSREPEMRYELRRHSDVSIRKKAGEIGLKPRRYARTRKLQRGEDKMTATPVTEHTRAKAIGCPRCKTPRHYQCRAETGRGVRPHLERVLAWEQQVGLQ